MPTLEHNGLIEIFREKPSLAPHFLTILFHVNVPAHAAVRVAEGLARGTGGLSRSCRQCRCRRAAPQAANAVGANEVEGPGTTRGPRRQRHRHRPDDRGANARCYACRPRISDMQTATLTNDGQINVPKPIQEALGVRPGDRIGFEILEDGTIMVRAERAEKVDLLSLRGVLKPKVRGVTVEDMNETLRKAAGGP
jgi:AbrB family looped-hinge helix DNA binding protein